MNAIQYTAFGTSGVLAHAQVDRPSIVHGNEVLLQVKASSVNPLDLKIRSGMMQGMRPVQLPYIPGLDAAGIVLEIGADVTGFQVGDEVMASSMGGTYAEYLIAKADNIILKPSKISFAEAAALIVPIGTTYSVLVEAGKLQDGQRVLIHGASGAVGLLMVQWAKSLGAYVIGTATGKGLAMIKSLGADEAIDYKTQDFASLVRDVDLVVDGVGHETQTRSFACLKKGGKLLSITMMPNEELAAQYDVEARFVSSNLSAKSLAAGLALVNEGLLQPFVSQTFTLQDAAQAQDLVSGGGVHGKVVLVIDNAQ